MFSLSGWRIEGCDGGREEWTRLLCQYSIGEIDHLIISHDKHWIVDATTSETSRVCGRRFVARFLARGNIFLSLFLLLLLLPIPFHSFFAFFAFFALSFFLWFWFFSCRWSCWWMAPGFPPVSHFHLVSVEMLQQIRLGDVCHRYLNSTTSFPWRHLIHNHRRISRQQTRINININMNSCTFIYPR